MDKFQSQNQEYLVGFIVARVWCSCCNLSFKDYLNKFYKLKEDFIFPLEERHEQMKPTACSGELTICYYPTVRIVKKRGSQENFEGFS